MQILKPSITTFLIITLATLAPSALSQSGRTRPKVDQPSPSTTPKPEPVKVPEAAAVIKQEQAGTTSRFVLRNGITVIISEHHATPIAAAVAYFKAGPSDEPWSMSGTAQLLERMILDGTVLRPGDRAVSDLRALGASLETRTSYDGAEYSLIAPTDKIKDALTIQADMLLSSAFDAEAMRRDIQLVIEEARHANVPLGPALPSHAFTTRTLGVDAGDQVLSRLRGFDDPATFSMARLFNMVVTGGALIASEALRSVTREQLVAYYRSHYRPDNLIVSIAGDISTFNTLVEIQQLYGEFGVRPQSIEEPNVKAADAAKTKAPSARVAVTAASDKQQPGPASPPPAERPSTASPSAAGEQTKLRYSADRADISQSIVSAGFRVPGTESRDWPVIKVLAAIAGQGRASRLSNALIDRQMVANRIEARYLGAASTGLLAIQTWPAGSREGSSIDKAESAMFKELDRLRHEIPTDGELARAKSILEKSFADENAIYLGRARALANAEAAGGGFRAALEARARIRAVSGPDVQRVAAKYLTLANTSIHEYEPVSAAPRTFDADTFTTTVNTWAPGFAQSVENVTVVTAAPNSSLAAVQQGAERPPDRQSIVESVEPVPIKDFSTLNGPKAFVREDHAQQSVTVAILFQGGRLVEDAATSGATELMLRTILYGTPRRTTPQITEELEQLGADIRIVVEPDFFGFTLSVLSRNSDRALKLLRDSIEEPAFRDEDVLRARLAQIASIREARDLSFTRARELLLQALYAGHPYSLPPHGREEVVAALTSEKVAEWYARVIRRQLPVAIIVGDTDGSALVSSQIAEGFKRRDVETAIQVKTPPPSAASEKSELRRREQTTIAAGLAGPKAESADSAAFRLIESAMNGRAGRLSKALSDKRSFVSMVGVEDEPMFASGLIAAYIITPAESEQQARTALTIEFERLARDGLAADELENARALATTSYVNLLQSQAQHALQYARAIFYRRQAFDVDTYREQAGTVTVDNIKRIAATYLKASALSAGIVRGTPK